MERAQVLGRGAKEGQQGRGQLSALASPSVAPGLMVSQPSAPQIRLGSPGASCPHLSTGLWAEGHQGPAGSQVVGTPSLPLDFPPGRGPRGSQLGLQVSECLGLMPMGSRAECIVGGHPLGMLVAGGPSGGAPAWR